jgi:hypothetical protein
VEAADGVTLAFDRCEPLEEAIVDSKFKSMEVVTVIGGVIAECANRSSTAPT